MPTLKELKQLATKYKIKGRSKMNKAQLEKALAKHVKSVKKSVKKSRKARIKKSRKSRVKKSRKARVKKSRKPVIRKSYQKRVYLHVPFRDKDLVKSLGAKWDTKGKRWFYEEGHRNASELDKWPVNEPHNPLGLLPRTHNSRKYSTGIAPKKYDPANPDWGWENNGLFYRVEQAKNNRSKDHITKQRIPKGTIKIKEKFYGYDDWAWRSYFIDSLFDSFEKRPCIGHAITGPQDYYINPDMPGAKETELYINKRANDLRISRAKKCKNYRWVAAHPFSNKRHGDGLGRYYAKPFTAPAPRKSRKVVSKSKRKPVANRIYLVVPYIEKDEVKRLGGRWDPVERQWYYFEGSKNADKLDYWRRPALMT